MYYVGRIPEGMSHQRKDGGYPGNLPIRRGSDTLQLNYTVRFGYIYPAIAIPISEKFRRRTVSVIWVPSKIDARDGSISSRGTRIPVPQHTSPSSPPQVAETGESPQFRPHRAAILMSHIQSVFHPMSTGPETFNILPLKELDVPQRILVSFGKTIFWAWTQWNDSRISGIESILIWV